MAKGDFVCVHPVYRIIGTLSNLQANFDARHSQNSGPGNKGISWNALSTALPGDC